MTAQHLHRTPGFLRNAGPDTPSELHSVAFSVGGDGFAEVGLESLRIIGHNNPRPQELGEALRQIAWYALCEAETLDGGSVGDALIEMLDWGDFGAGGRVTPVRSWATCRLCGESLQSANPRAKFCSNACRQENYRLRLDEPRGLDAALD